MEIEKKGSEKNEENEVRLMVVNRSGEGDRPIV
jgi:hypothetical protein